MSSSTTTDLFRASLADDFLAGLSGAQFKFGDGGHNPETGAVLAANPAQTDLNNPLLTKSIFSASKPTATSVKAVGRLLQDELVGESISEGGLFVGGDLIAVRNCGVKVKENDEVYDFEITVTF